MASGAAVEHTAAETMATADRTGRPSLRERLVPPMPTDVLWGWLGPLLIAVVAGVLRFWHLGSPRSFVFDETYYAKDAYSLLRFGVERQFVDDANAKLLAGNTDVFSGQPSFVVHPPAGKWVIAVGEWVFGVDPFGWRVMLALFGTLSVLMVARIARRLTRSTLLGCVAGLLLAFDGLHFVMSRTSLLDLLLMFWLLAAFGCLVVDRDRTRERLAAYVEAHGVAGHGVTGRGPGLGWRPWRLAAGACIGLATATKWSGVFAVVVFGLLTVIWDRGARRAVGVRRPTVAMLVRDAAPAFASIVVLGLVVYLLAWTGWFVTDDGWDRHWADGRDTAWPILPDALRSLWHYHHDAYVFHRDLRADHPYKSNPYGWLILARPISYFFESPKQGSSGCEVAQCSREILAIGTPVLWWGALFALLYMGWLWLGRRDWRGGAVLAGVAATMLPWFQYQARTIYYFYAVAAVPFLVLGVTLTLGAVLGPAGSRPRRRQIGALAAGAFVLLVIANFIWFRPILVGDTLPQRQWQQRVWFTHWI